MRKSNKKKLRVILTRITQSWPEAEYETTPWMLSLGLHYIKNHCLADPEIEKHIQITVKTFDMHLPVKHIAGALADLQPDIVGFSCYVTGYSETVRVAAEVKRLLPATHVIFGGPHAFDAEAETTRHDFLDAVIPYEGEVPFKEMLLCRLHGTPLNAVKGIAFRDGADVVYTGDRKDVFNISEIPEIFTESFVKNLSGSIIYESSRGCKYSCGYCSYANQKYREFPMERVKTELERILKRDEIKQIIFVDLDLANNPGRFNEILDFIIGIRKDIQLSGFWSSTGKILECAKKMKEAGFIRGFTVSLQCADKNVLKKCGRSWLTLEHLEKTTPTILESFPESRVQLILGLPGQTLEAFIKTHVVLYRLGYKVFHVADLMVTPGSRFYWQREALGLEYYDADTYTLKRTPDLSEEDLRICRNFSVNFQVLALLFPREYAGLYEKWGIDLAELAARIPPLEKYCPSASESGAVYNFINEDAIEQVAEFIRDFYGLKKDRAELIKEFLIVEYRIFRFERLQRERKASVAAPRHIPLIDKFLEIDVSRETCESLGLKIKPDMGGKSRMKVFVLYNRKTQKAVPTVAPDEKLYTRLLQNAGRASSVRELIHSFDGDLREKTMLLIVRLAQAGFTSLNSTKDILL